MPVKKQLDAVPEKKASGNRLPLFLLILMIFLIIASVSVAVYYFLKFRQNQKYLSNPQFAVSIENQKILDSLKKIMVLPDETPTIATVSDKDKLASQPFFAKAKNGDKVLLFIQAKKVILYDPITSKIIDIAPLNVSSSAAQTNSALTPSPQPVRILLYNGTDTTGLTKKYESRLKEKLPSVTVVDRDNAKKNDYQKTILIDLKGNSTKAAEIAQKLGLSVEKLPEGESALPTPPSDGSADFLIIVGTDKI